MPFTEQQIAGYEERILPLADLHIEFERQFQDFTSIIPCKHHWEIREQIFSPSLFSLLQGINSVIDGLSKILGEMFDVSPERDQAFHLLNGLNNEGMLGIQTLALVEYPSPLKPFETLSPSNAPLWWTGYNSTKHKLAEGGMFKATLGNVIDALAALVALLHISNTRLSDMPLKAMLKAQHWKSREFISDFKLFRFTNATDNDLGRVGRPYMDIHGEKYKSSILYYLTEFSKPSL